MQEDSYEIKDFGTLVSISTSCMRLSIVLMSDENIPCRGLHATTSRGQAGAWANIDTTTLLELLIQCFGNEKLHVNGSGPPPHMFNSNKPLSYNFPGSISIYIGSVGCDKEMVGHGSN